MTGGRLREALAQSLFGLFLQKRASEERSVLALLPCSGGSAALWTEECDAQERAQTGRHERGRSVYSPGGGWSTCSNSQSYPEEMKTSISAEPHTKSLSLPPMARFTIFCFHSWLRDCLSLPICTSRPGTEPNTNPLTHSGGKLKS